MNNNKFFYSFAEYNNELNLIGDNVDKIKKSIELSIPIPEGFFLSNEIYTKYKENNMKITSDVEEALKNELIKIDNKLTSRILFGLLGEAKTPLLFNLVVDLNNTQKETILNIGLNDNIVEEITKTCYDKTAIYRKYMNFIKEYSVKIAKIPEKIFDDNLNNFLIINNKKSVEELFSYNYLELIKIYKKVYEYYLKQKFPNSLIEQLINCIKYVYDKHYNSNLNILPSITIQRIPFNDLNTSCGVGIIFTRNPATGEKNLYGEYLMYSNFEELYNGVKIPSHIVRLPKKTYDKVINICNNLEQKYNKLFQLNFILEDDKIYIVNINEK